MILDHSQHQTLIRTNSRTMTWSTIFSQIYLKTSQPLDQMGHLSNRISRNKMHLISHLVILFRINSKIKILQVSSLMSVLILTHHCPKISKQLVIVVGKTSHLNQTRINNSNSNLKKQSSSQIRSLCKVIFRVSKICIKIK